MQIDAALDPDDVDLQNELSDLSHDLLQRSRPLNLTPGAADNPADEVKRSNEELFAILEERGVQRPKELTEYELFARLETYKRHDSKRG